MPNFMEREARRECGQARRRDTLAGTVTVMATGTGTGTGTGTVTVTASVRHFDSIILSQILNIVVFLPAGVSQEVSGGVALEESEGGLCSTQRPIR